MIRTINNIKRTLLFHAFLPPSYWFYALETATYLLNILPSKVLNNNTPAFTLFGRTPSYDHIRVFGCLCFPNLSATAPNKLSPRSTPCVFLGYPVEHRGYRCLDLRTYKIIISRHVVFEETTFLFRDLAKFHSSDYDFSETFV